MNSVVPPAANLTLQVREYMHFSVYECELVHEAYTYAHACHEYIAVTLNARFQPTIGPSRPANNLHWQRINPSYWSWVGIWLRGRCSCNLGNGAQLL